MSDSDIPSSQQTEEYPTLPGSPAERATIILRPDNAKEKLAFSEVVDWLHAQSADPSVMEAREHAKQYIWISPTQRQDSEVKRLLRASVAQELSSSPLSSPRNSHSAPQLEFWHGAYYLSLDKPPRHPERDWLVGRLKDKEKAIPSDLVLSLRLKQDPVGSARHQHALFQIHNTGRIAISAPRNAYTKVDGKRVFAQAHVLNQAFFELTFGSLSYRIEYARASSTEDYAKRLSDYLGSQVGTKTSTLELSLTPTPAEKDVIKVGEWTLQLGTIGTGAFGKVSIGSNNKGRVVALKRMLVDKARTLVLRRQQKLQILTALSHRHNESRLCLLIDVITDDANAKNDTADIWFVLEPAVLGTLKSVSEIGLLGTDDKG